MADESTKKTGKEPTDQERENQERGGQEDSEGEEYPGGEAEPLWGGVGAPCEASESREKNTGEGLGQ